MNKIQEKRNRELMHELLDIVLDTNGLNDRKCEETGTLPTVFFEFNGHISMLQIDLHEDGWTYRDHHKTCFEFAVDKPISSLKVKKVREACAEALKGKEDL